MQSVDIGLVVSEIVEDCYSAITPFKTVGWAVWICRARSVLVAEYIVRHDRKNYEDKVKNTQYM